MRRFQCWIPLVDFFDAFTGLMQMLLFFLLGLLAFPSQLPIGAEHPWVGKQIREGDTVVLGDEGYADHQDILLKEITITPEHRCAIKGFLRQSFIKIQLL